MDALTIAKAFRNASQVIQRLRLEVLVAQPVGGFWVLPEAPPLLEDGSGKTKVYVGSLQGCNATEDAQILDMAGVSGTSRIDFKTVPAGFQPVAVFTGTQSQGQHIFVGYTIEMPFGVPGTVPS